MAEAGIPGGSPGHFPKPPIMCCVCSNKNLRISDRFMSSEWPASYTESANIFAVDVKTHIKGGSNPESVACIDSFVASPIEPDKVVFV